MLTKPSTVNGFSAIIRFGFVIVSAEAVLTKNKLSRIIILIVDAKDKSLHDFKNPTL